MALARRQARLLPVRATPAPRLYLVGIPDTGARIRTPVPVLLHLMPPVTTADAPPLNRAAVPRLLGAITPHERL